MNRPKTLVTMTESFNEDVFMLYQQSAGAGVAKGRKARVDWLTDSAESPHWMLLRVSLVANPDHASYILASVDEWQATKPIDVQRLAENASTLNHLIPDKFQLQASPLDLIRANDLDLSVAPIQVEPTLFLN